MGKRSAAIAPVSKRQVCRYGKISEMPAPGRPDSELVRVLLVDDHSIVREGLEGVIRESKDMLLAGSVGSGKEALGFCRQQAVDIVLLDLRMPDMDGIETLVALKALTPSLHVIVLTSDDREASVRRAMDAGATGFLSKSVRAWDLLEALRKVHRHGRLPLAPELAARVRPDLGFPSLTTREQEVLSEMALGCGNEEISETLGVSLNTVKTHVNSVLTKLGAASRTEAVVMGIRKGLVNIE
jgi:DNA-binding NarL/FixJ family response regulator